jgi:pimeloyl-ACP methyl ester carboxylesterase
MRRAIRILKYILAGVALLLLVALLAGYTIRTVYQAQAADQNRIQSPNGIESLEQVTLGGIAQWIYIRSDDRDKPVLLFLHGGPGSPEMPFATKRFQGKLEQEFVVVHWDQRGAGKSYSSGLAIDSFTLDDYVADTVELTQLLLRRFHKQKLYLVGHSWGSALGMVTISRHPQYYHAYVGIGQVSNMDLSEKLSYRFALEEARKRGETEKVARLERMGEPPFQKFVDVGFERSLVNEYGGGIHNESSPMLLLADAYFKFPGYTTLDFVYRFPVGSFRTLVSAWPWVQKLDLFTAVPQVKVPVYFCSGRHDQTVPAQLSYRYFQSIKAPQKKFFWFEHSAHSPNFEEAEKFYRILTEQVLAGKG